MPDIYKKLSDYPELSILDDDSLLLVSQDGTTYSMSGATLKALCNSGAVLPAVTVSDNGKILRVVNGAWTVDDFLITRTPNSGGGDTVNID